MEIAETIYEDIGTKTDKNFNTKVSLRKNSMKERRNGVVSHGIFDSEDEECRHDEEEDIYEVIPADFAPSLYSGKSSRSSSISSQGSARSVTSERTPNVSTVGIQTDGENPSPNSSPMTTAHDAQEDQEAETTAHYAEILHASNTEILDITRSRPTRESKNPILRQDFSKLTENSKFLVPPLQNIRDSLAVTSKSKHTTSERTVPAHLLLKRSLSSGDNTNGFVRRSVDVLYENSLFQSPNHSPRAKHSSASAPVYENMKFPLVESDRESHCSISSSSTEGRSLCSEEENTGENVESLYENVDGLTEGYRERTTSRPIDIVYSDLEFQGPEKSHPLLSSVDNEEMTASYVQRNAKSLSATTSKPSPPPRGSGLNRPKSLCLRRPAGGSLGLHLAKFVKKVVVQRSNDKTLQATILEVLSKKHTDDDDDDDESSVNVEVNSDLVRISTNFPPWEVIASCDIERIGHVNLYQGDKNVLGIIACPLGEESTCYIIRCPDAKNIYESIKNAFKAPNLRQFTHTPSPDVPSLHVFPGEESFTSIPRITYLGCVKVKKSYLVINDSIDTLLDKLHPKDFKPITLKIRPEEILIVDENTQETLHHHSISWILSLGVFSEDSRLFGYIVTEARQGEKTRMFCHAFRCGRVTASVTATETIRIACQATFAPGRKDSVKSRRDSQRSLRSSTSSDAASSLELRYSTSDPIDAPENTTNEQEETQKITKHKTHSPARLFRKLTPRKNSFSPSKSSFRSYTSEPNLSSLSSSGSFEETSPEITPKNPPEIIEEKEFIFRAVYLCSTVISPPLKPKHLRDSVKQYLKEQKKTEKHKGTPPPTKEVELTLNCDGVSMSEPQCKSFQRYFPFPSISNVRTHKDYPEYFAFSEVVSGGAKHKCHIFKRVKEPCDEITAAFECFLWEKV